MKRGVLLEFGPFAAAVAPRNESARTSIDSISTGVSLMARTP